MLTYGEINKIKSKVISDCRTNCGKYKIFWEYAQKEICSKKYSAGGNEYPYGMYFVSKITEKEYNEPLGHFTDDPKRYTFEYCYSGDGRLKIITKKGERRTFLEYNGGHVSLFSYDINNSERSPKFLTAIAYEKSEENRKIFVNTSIWRINGFSLDIEETVTRNGSTKG